MKAVIMAGGEGSRLRPLTCETPKPMVSMLSVPILETIIALLKKQEFLDIALTLKYMPEKIMKHFKDGRDYGVRLSYFIENEPLGTAGSVKNAEKFLDDDFVIVSGDALCDVDLNAAAAFHYKKKALVTIVLKRAPEPLEYGVALCTDQSDVIRFVEKPSWAQVFSDTVNTGIYVLDRSVLSRVPQNKPFDFSKDLFPEILQSGGKIAGFTTDGYWSDIGDSDAFRQGCFDILTGRVKIFGAPGMKIAQGIKPREIYGVSITPPVFIGENVEIEKGCELGPLVVLEDDCRLGQNCRVKHSVLKKGAVLRENCEVKGAVLGEGVKIKKSARIFEGVVVGDGSVVGEDALLLPDTKIWPHKTIGPGGERGGDIMWGEQKVPALFKEDGISGDPDFEITPEFAFALGRAAGGLFQKGYLLISCEEEKKAAFFKDLIVSGLLSRGMGVIEAAGTSYYEMSYLVGRLSQKGGVFVTENDGDVKIKILNNAGFPVGRNDERKLESLLRAEKSGAERTRGKLKEKVYLGGAGDFYKSDIAEKYPIKTPVPFWIEGTPGKMFSLLRDVLLEMGADCYPKRQENMAGAAVDGDLVTLFSEDGEKIETGTYLTLLTEAICRNLKAGSVLYLPESFPSRCGDIGEKYRIDCRKVTELFVVNHEDNRALFDPVFGAAYLLHFLSKEKKPLGSFLSEVPKIGFAKGGVFCEDKDKGKVMRLLIEENKIRSEDLIEGVTIKKDDGTVVKVVPHKNRPSCRVWVEAMNEEYAKEICADFEKKIRDITKNKSLF